MKASMCSFIMFCLFVWGFSSNSRIFHSYGYFTMAGEGLLILTYPRHSWSLSSESFLACHTCCDTGHPFIMVISETHTYCRAFISGTATTWFYDLGLSRLGFEHPTFRLRGKRLNQLRHHRGFQIRNCI